MGGVRTGYNRAGLDFNQFSHWVHKHAADFGGESAGIEGAKAHLLDEVRTNFRSFLDARTPDRPFCYWWGPTNTHRSWQRGSGKAQWGIDPDSLTGRLPAFLPDVHDIREDAADYLGEAQAFDHGLGVLLEELTASGELDNTLLIVSGDHGIPGLPRAKCNLYDIGCEVALAARWPGRIDPGRVVEDFINLMDLAPTLCEAGGTSIPESMSARSAFSLLTSTGSGQIEPARDHVVMGRERHIAHAREGFLPYPQRSIREREYIYIINFEPDRWPMGDPKGLDDPSTPAPDFKALSEDVGIAYRDMDASPTKAWIIHHRDEDDVERCISLPSANVRVRSCTTSGAIHTT